MSIMGLVMIVNLFENGIIDWEVELVVVIGVWVFWVLEFDVWGYVVGFVVGQDLLECELQFVGLVLQFGFVKLFVGFSLVGLWLVIVDEFVNFDDLELGCVIDGEMV